VQLVWIVPFIVVGDSGLDDRVALVVLDLTVAIRTAITRHMLVAIACILLVRLRFLPLLRIREVPS